MLANYLAELWGISLVIIPLVMLIKEQYVKQLFESAQDDKKLLNTTPLLGANFNA